MGFDYAVPAIVGGTVLVIERIQSQNYVAGVSGWAIMADGSAEFSNVVVRGSLVGGLVVINGTAYPNAIALYTSNPSEVTPAIIDPHSSGNRGYVRIAGPTTLTGATPATFDLSGYTDGHSTAELDVDSMRLTAGTTATIESSALRLSGDFTTYLTLINGYAQVEGETWHAPTFANSWVDVAGGRAGYFIDATGRVQLRGQVVSGTAATVFTLPTGYRPTQSMEWVMRGVGGTVLCAVQVATTGVVSVTANLATAQASGIKLDAISFPTF